MYGNKALRIQKRKLRQKLNSEDHKKRGQAVFNHLAMTELLNQVRVLGAYIAFDGELDLSPLIKSCWKAGITIAIPQLQKSRLIFRNYTPNSKLVKTELGLLAPKADVRIPLQKLAAILVPLTAFTKKGDRLGMGAGYYDRSLKEVPDLIRIGVAHAFQEVSEVDTHCNDVTLDAVVTEKSFVITSRRGKSLPMLQYAR